MILRAQWGAGCRMGERKIVLVTGSHFVTDQSCSHIESRGYEVRHVKDDHLDAVSLHEALDGVSGYLIGGYEEPADEHFARHRELEAVAWLGTDYKPAVPGWKLGQSLGVAFLTSPGTNAAAVAEFTLLLCLSMLRPVNEHIARPASAVGSLPVPGRECAGLRLGVIGLGRIGARVARLATGFGMTVSYFGPRRKTGTERELGIAYKDRLELLSSSDILTLHRPGPVQGETPELLSGDLALLPEEAVIINTVHPRLIDLPALLEEMRTRRISAAFDGVADDPVWQELLALGTDRFLAMPSMAFNTRDANARASMKAARAVCDVLDGGSPPEVDNPDFRQARSREDSIAEHSL